MVKKISMVSGIAIKQKPFAEVASAEYYESASDIRQ